MRWHRRELAVLKSIELEDTLTIDPSLFASNGLLSGLKEVNVSGNVKYDEKQDLVYVDLEVYGVMICPCALTGEDVDYPFDTEYSEVFSFDNAEEYDAYQLENDELNLKPVIEDIVLQEVPLKVVKKGKIDYPKGKGWSVTTEKEYAKRKSEEIDPRLAVLKDYKFDDKEE